MKPTTKDIVYIALLAALCIVATIIRIPLPNGAMVHLGSAALFTTSAIFGGLYGGLGAAIGSAIFDIVTGHTAYTLFSFVIKGLCGIIIGYFTIGVLPPAVSTPRVGYARLLLALLLGAAWTALGYFIAWGIVIDSWTVALTMLPATFMTSGVGIVVAVLLYPKLYGLLKKR